MTSKIILKEKIVTVSLIPPHQQDIMKKRHYWRLDSKSITMFKVKKNVQGKKMFKVDDKTFKVWGWEFSYLSVGPIIDTAGPT